MANIKHVGRLVKNQRKVIVAYRVLPGSPEECLIIPTESLGAAEHDSVINLVESDAGQSAYEFAEAMSRAVLPDGRNMLAAFHTTGKLLKMPTAEIEMTPSTTQTLILSELNNMIAEQQGVTVADLAIKGPNNTQSNNQVSEEPKEPVEVYTNKPSTPESEVLSDEDLAAQLRSQADTMFKEAKRLREQAEELAPTKKKTSTKKKTEESA